MLPKSVQNDTRIMLELPPNWRSCSTEFVVGALLRQADAIGQYHAAALAMTRSSLDFMLSGPRWTGRPERPLLAAHSRGYRIEDWLIYVLPNVDDQSMDELSGLRQLQCGFDLIAPPWAARTARSAVQSFLTRTHADVYSIDSYIDLRLLWTRLDMDKSHSDALATLLALYMQSETTVPDISIRSIH
jgi:hypothetical protein